MLGPNEIDLRMVCHVFVDGVFGFGGPGVVGSGGGGSGGDLLANGVRELVDESRDGDPRPPPAKMPSKLDHEDFGGSPLLRRPMAM